MALPIIDTLMITFPKHRSGKLQDVGFPARILHHRHVATEMFRGKFEDFFVSCHCETPEWLWYDQVGVEGRSSV